VKLFEKIKVKKEREIRVFGIPIFQYGTRFIGGYEEKYFKLFPRNSFLRSLLRNLYKELDKKYDIVWILRVNALGESYLLNYLFEEIAKYKKTERYCFIIHNESHRSMFQMFSDTKIITTKIDREILNALLQKKIYKYKNTEFRVHHCGIEELNKLFSEKYINGYDKHYAEVIKDNAGAKNFTYLPIRYSDEVKNEIKKVKNLDLSNFIFISPDAKSVLNLTNEYWQKHIE